jgi:dTMP kinase
MSMLITLEGLDGAGKTTLADGLARRFAHPLTVLREPGGVELSERIRGLVKDPSLDVGLRAEALLFAASRAQLVSQEVLPRLERGEWVLLDRFVDSSLAYQGAARGLGIPEVRELNAFATTGLVPDRTLLLRLSPAARAARLGGRGDAPDRLEREADPFFEAVAAAYDELAAAEPERWRVLDAARPPDDVLQDALAALSDLA